MPTENRSRNTEMASELRPCPFCSADMRVESNRDWHRVMGDHTEEWVFTDSETMMVPATNAQRSIMVADWNQRTQPAEQHQGEKVACAHEWTDDGEFMLVCTACGAQENHDPKWRDMANAPRDGTLVRLLVEFTEHATEDSDAMPCPTIGANSFDHTGEDVWQFAGWSWEQDCFTQGEGEPVGWLPLLDTPHADPGEVERLRADLAEWKKQAAYNQDTALRWQADNEALRAQLAEAHALLRDIKQTGMYTAKGPSITERIDAALSASAEPSAPVERDADAVRQQHYDEFMQRREARAALERKP